MQNKRDMRVIGITGGIGAGKSKLLDYIGKHYRCEIYLADQVAHEMKEPGTACYMQLLDLLGEEILGEDGRIDNGKMARMLFDDLRPDRDLLQQTNQIIHPAVKEYLLARMESARVKGETELFFIEAALLIEAGYLNLVDEMWYVYAGDEIRRERLRRTRGYSEERIDSTMASQMSDGQFRMSCDFIIDNSGALEDSYAQIDKKLEAYTWQE